LAVGGEGAEDLVGGLGLQALQPGAALAAITDTSTNTPTAPAFSGRMKLDPNVHKLTTKDRS
jgi:hypothetical protein